MSRNQQLHLYQIDKFLLHSANKVQLIRSKIVLAKQNRKHEYKMRNLSKGAVVKAVFGSKHGNANGPRDRNEKSHPNSIVK